MEYDVPFFSTALSGFQKIFFGSRKFSPPLPKASKNISKIFFCPLKRAWIRWHRIGCGWLTEKPEEVYHPAKIACNKKKGKCREWLFPFAGTLPESTFR
jgi:hypothetical protein